MVPFFLLLCLNTLLMHYIIYTRKQTGIAPVTAARNIKNKSMTRTVMVMTLTFVSLTGPFAFIGINKYINSISEHHIYRNKRSPTLTNFH